MSTVEEATAEITKRLAALTPSALAAFFAACAERLLPLYDDFARSAGWGDAQAVHRVVDQVWAMLEAGVVSGTAALAKTIEEQTPHADDFDSLEATLAQDVCICIDGALQALEGRGDPELVEYAIEALRVAITCDRTGYLDLGDAPVGSAIAAEIFADPRMQHELTAQRADAERLAGADGSMSEVIAVLRERARDGAWSFASLGVQSESP